MKMPSWNISLDCTIRVSNDTFIVIRCSVTRHMTAPCISITPILSAVCLQILCHLAIASRLSELLIMNTQISQLFVFEYVIVDEPFNIYGPRQNGRHFADDTFKRIFLNENVIISIKIPLKFVPKVPIDSIPALVQIMASRRPGDKPLSAPMIAYQRIYASLGLNELKMADEITREEMRRQVGKLNAHDVYRYDTIKHRVHLI